MTVGRRGCPHPNPLPEGEGTRKDGALGQGQDRVWVAACAWVTVAGRAGRCPHPGPLPVGEGTRGDGGLDSRLRGNDGTQASSGVATGLSPWPRHR